MTDLVQYEVCDRIAHVTISNGKANALAPDVIAGLDQALSRAEDAGPDAVGALCITGTPGVLTGGFDLKVMQASPESAGRLVTDGGAFFARCYGSEVPVIVACPGHAVAAGALMLLGADYRIGARGAFRIGLVETQIGMVLPRWAIELAQERLSRRRLQEATVGARMYDADGAADAGFLDRVVEPDALADAAAEEAKYWAELPRPAYRGQVLANRAERLGRLADAIAQDRGRTFDIRT